MPDVDRCHAGRVRSHHLILRPGTPVMAREPGVLQIGLHDPLLRVRDEPAARELLQRLNQPGVVRPAPVGQPTADRLLARLDAVGLLVAVPDDERTTDRALDALRAQFGRDAPRRHDTHAGARIAVQASEEDGALLTGLLDQAGLRRTTLTDPAADVHLVVTRGSVDRERLDPLIRDSAPHLVLSGGAAGRRIGPFVAPGRTACLRCVDAHEALHDARLPLLLCQAARTAAERPPPADPLLDQIAFAWAVRDLCRYVEGDEPSTWSTTVDLDARGLARQSRWGRHPDCGCAWDVI